MITQALKPAWTTQDKIECAFFGTLIGLGLPALLVIAAQ